MSCWPLQRARRWAAPGSAGRDQLRRQHSGRGGGLCAGHRRCHHDRGGRAFGPAKIPA